jgi:septal ring factor EnvC (AmiA/AmiB activator)
LPDATVAQGRTISELGLFLYAQLSRHHSFELIPADRSTKFLLLVAFLLAIPATAFCVENQKQLQEHQLLQLRERIAALNKSLESKRGERDSLMQGLRKTEVEIGQIVVNHKDTTKDLKKARKRVETLQRKKQLQENSLSRQRIALGNQIRAAHAMGRQERTKILFNQRDPAELSRAMGYYDYLHRARATRMAAIQTQLSELKETVAQIVLEQQKLEQAEKRQLTQKKKLESAQMERKKVLGALSSELKRSGQQLRTLYRDEQQLEQLIRGISETLSDISIGISSIKDFVERRGAMQWPAAGRIDAMFGTPRIGNLSWDGVLIAAPEGSEVKAVHRGRIAYADWLRGFGLLMIIDHGGGYMTLYGHNQSLFKETGDWVEAGEAIASVGTSGGLGQAAVYFGIRRKGRAVNPARWCKRLRNRRAG